MLKIFSEVLFILMFLVSSFFVVYDIEANSKIRLSEKYRPPGNPGGANFNDDEDFVESYKLYEKRREFLRKKKLQSRANANVEKDGMAKKLEKKKITIINNELKDLKTCMIDNEEEDAMINQHGVNIACLKGAIFIDQSITREKKISPVGVVIKDAKSKKTCSHDSITSLNNVMQYNTAAGGSDSFGSVADDTAE